MNLPRFSLTTRLTTFYSLVSTAVLFGMGLLVTVLVERHFEEMDQRFLDDKIELVLELSKHASSNEDLRLRLTDALNHHADLHVLVRDEKGIILFVMPDQLPIEELGDDQVLETGGMASKGHIYRVRSTDTVRNFSPYGSLRVVTAFDTERHAGFLSSFRQTLWWYGSAVAILSGLLSWWAARSGLAPLGRMRDRALAVTANKLDHRMPVEAVPIEMASLAKSLNQMFERLEQDFNRLSEFSTDIAHELRTPISNLMTQTQVALAQHRCADEYRDILASNAEEFQRLARTVSEMLFLAKAENIRSLPNTEIIELADEVKSLLDFYEALAEETGITFRLEGEGRMTGDRLVVRRALSNLLSNALRHADADSTVNVGIRSVADQLTVTVSNKGEPIDPAAIPRLFDRFFRADRSRRQIDAEGAGLGLPIGAAIMHAHGGTASVQSISRTTAVKLIFPANARLDQI